MAKQSLLALPSTSTRALVVLSNKRFEDSAGEPDPDFITADIDIRFNGSNTGHIGQTITYSIDNTKTQTANAVKVFINQLLDQFEPGNILNNSKILIDGLSD